MIDHAARQVEQARQRMEGTRTSPSPPAQSKDIPEPGSIPGYEILRKIERGGQGVVYRAIQEGTKREVAIKVMREGPFAGSGDKARFEREIQVLGQLNHPNIVTVHHSGSASSGHFYYVMDYVDGQPLDAWSAEKERPVDETLRLFLKICDAVNAAHVRGIIHRDLKPSNIRVDPDGEPQVMDFGLAKLATPDATDEALPSVTTLSGQFVGSLPWASPEQAEGAPGKIDIRTDVYSLGVILYQMLTGRFPYDVTGSLRDVLTNIIDAEPVKPRTVRRQMHDDVETIVLQCLDKDRDGRYQSAGELARDIRRYLNGEPIDPKHHKLLYVIGKTLTRHWRQCSVAAAAALLVIIGAYLAIGEFQAMRARSNAARLARLDSWLNDMRWWFDSGQYKSAIRYADRVLADHPDHFEARVLRIQALRNQGRDENAEDEARSLQAKHPENAVLFFLLSKLTEDSKPDESAAFHQRGQSLVKEDPEQYYLRALINENDDEAIELLKSRLGKCRTNAEFLMTMSID